ncbi:MAG: exodeoxyribonuclease VII small subunit [Planctomycetota bacterium]
MPLQPEEPVPPVAVPFEAALADLNDLVNRLESGTLGLSESIGAYERGVSILRHLHEQLADVEERVRLLVRIDEQGRPILETPGVQASAEESATDGSPAGRRSPRTAPKPVRAKQLPGMDEAP